MPIRLSHAIRYMLYPFHMLTFYHMHPLIWLPNHYHMHSVFTCFSSYLLYYLYFMYKSTLNTALDSSLVLTVNLSHLRLRSLEDLSEDTLIPIRY
jgi:hypothetical protein